MLISVWRRNIFLVTVSFVDMVKLMDGSVQVDFEDRKKTKNELKQQLYYLLTVYAGKTLPWGTLTGIRPTKIPMELLEEGKSCR